MKKRIIWLSILFVLMSVLLFKLRQYDDRIDDVSKRDNSFNQAEPGARPSEDSRSQLKKSDKAMKDRSLVAQTTASFGSATAANSQFDEIEPKMQFNGSQRIPQNLDGLPFPSSPGVLRTSVLWKDSYWQIWRGVRVIAAPDFDSGAGLKVIGKLGSYVFVESESASALNSEGMTEPNGNSRDHPSDALDTEQEKLKKDQGPSKTEDLAENNFSVKSPLAVFSSAENHPGVLTGVFIVALHDMKDMQAFVADYDLLVKGVVSPTKKIYIVPRKPEFDLLSTLESFKKDPRVQTANPEVVSRQYGY